MQDIKASHHALVSIIVVSRNKKNLLRKCLKSIYAQSYKNYEVIVVDNASQDGSPQMVTEEFPEIKLIISNNNLYYCEGYNLGISQARGDYILCINNDVFLDVNFVSYAIRGFYTDDRIGQVTGKILNPTTQRIDSTGQFLSLSRRAIERGYRKDLNCDWPQGFIWGCPGCCVMYRKKMLEEIKLNNGEYFDGSYRAYLEDLDLNWRANKFGWKAYYIPEAIAYHYRGKTGWVNSQRWGYLNLSPEFKFQFIRNRYATILKNEQLIDYFLHLPFILSYDIYLWFFLFTTSPQYIIKFWEHRDWIKQAIIKRNYIIKKIKEHKHG